MSGIIIPLYVYPSDGAWGPVLDAAETHPSVPIVAIANVNSGVGSAVDPNYQAAIKELQAQGVKVLGYTDTAYGDRALPAIIAEMTQWESWYAVDGFFFDDLDSSGYEDTMRSIKDAAPTQLCFGNPGVAVPASYLGIFDDYCTAEHGWTAGSQWTSGGPNTSAILYGANEPQDTGTVFNIPQDILALAKAFDFIYVTNATVAPANPYWTISPYLMAMAKALDGSAPPTGQPPQPHAYVQPVVFRPNGTTFAGRTLTTTVKAGAFTATSQETITGVNMAADYSVQQNLFAAEHLYQNSLIQNAEGGLVWHLECFEPNGTLPNGKPSFPADGQFYRTTDSAGLSASGNPWGSVIPASIDLRTGGYTVQFFAQDDGSSTISLRCVILNGENQVYDSGWAVVTDAFMQPGVEAESGGWYDSLTAASIAIVGVGSGETATFTGGPFNVSFDAGVPDLQAGGQYWYQGVPYEDPIEAALPGIGTAETSNLTFPLANLDTQASIPPGSEASVNGYTGTVQLRTTDTIEWDGSGLTDDEGGVAQFGIIPHGVDPAPQGAGFMVLDEQKVDDGALVRGTLAYSGALEAMLPDTRALNVVEGLVVDAYVYDNAASSPKGYSQAVVLTFTNVLAFVGSTD